jgi:hypothetical protein
MKIAEHLAPFNPTLDCDTKRVCDQNEEQKGLKGEEWKLKMVSFLILFWA